jgi:hypothetical protein
MRRSAAPALCALLALAGSNAASQSVPPAPDPFTVISRIDNTQSVESADLKLLLTKARREEHAVVRRLLFIAATLRLTEPVAAPPAAPSDAPPPKQTCRWSYRAFLQRQICFVSMTGLSSCTQPELIALPDTAEGDALISDAPQQGVCNDIFRPAVNARIRLTSSLLSRSKDLFAADQQTKVDPQFKAASVTVVLEGAAK